MVSQSRLYLALLAVMATMAFWLGLWCSAVSDYEDFREPKPARAADEIFFVEVAKKPMSKNFNSKSSHLMIFKQGWLNSALDFGFLYINVFCRIGIVFQSTIPIYNTV